MKTLISFCLLFAAGTATAQEEGTSETASPENPAPEETATPEEASPTPIAAPMEKTVASPEAPAEPVAEPQIEVQVTLANGLTLRGSASQSTLLGWSPGNPFQFTPTGGISTTLTGDKIVAITQAGVDAQPSAAAAKFRPKSNYTSPGGFSFPNPAASRYLYAPSAIPLQQGQGYVSQKYGLFSSVAYAPSDNFTMLFGTLTLYPPAMTIFGGKFGFEIAENVHVSFGGETFIFPIEASILASIGFGAVTFGTTDKHLTIATGYLHPGDGDIFDESSIPLMVAGQTRLSDGFALVTENWILFETDGDWVANIHSVAARFVGRRDRLGGLGSRGRMLTSEGHPRTTWDVGLIALVDQYGGIGPIPWLDWTYHFGPSGH